MSQEAQSSVQAAPQMCYKVHCMSTRQVAPGAGASHVKLPSELCSRGVCVCVGGLGKCLERKNWVGGGQALEGVEIAHLRA